MNLTTKTTVLQKLQKFKEMPIVIFTIMVYCVFSMMAPTFGTATNLSVIVMQITINGIVALGMTMVIMIGGMDLSVGSILSLCGCFAGMVDNMGLPILVVVGATLVLGMICGLINGLLITNLNIPDIIVTLATMNIYRGLAVVMTDSKWITGFSQEFLKIGSNLDGIKSISVISYVVIAIAFAVGLKYLPFGRLLYAVGGNKEAALLMGINIDRVKLKVYTINGFLLGVAGIIFASMFGSIQAATAATSLQFQTMASALIGGANIFGGTGSVIGTVAGTLLLGIMKNGLVQIRVSEYWLDFATGSIILIALIVNLIRAKRKVGQ